MKLSLNKKRKTTKKICEQSFSIVPYIDTSKKQFILSKLLEYYNEIKEDDIGYIICSIRAQIDSLIIAIVTDIEMDENTDYETMLSSGLIDMIRKTVTNYDEIYQDALFLIQTTKLSEMFPDIGGVFSTLTDTLNNMSPEQKENFELIMRASLANSASNSILKSVMGDS